MPLSPYLQAALIAHTYGGPVYVQPTAYTLGLFSVSPSQTAAGTELSGFGYARQPITFDLPFDQPEDPLTFTRNLIDVTFPPATANWATANAYCVFDQLGNQLVYNPLTPAVSVLTGQQYQIAAGQLEIDWS